MLLACRAGVRGNGPAKAPAAGRLEKRMSRRLAHLIALSALLTALVLPGAASASPSAVVRDCAEDGSVDGNYSDEDKQAALGQIPADLDEYSDCRAAISSSIKGKRPKAGTSSNGDASGGGDDEAAAAAPAAKARARKTRQARAQGKRRKRVAALVEDHSDRPAASGVFNRAATENGLPLPTLLALIALTLLLAGGALAALARRNPGLLATLRRVPLPRRR
jgi:hypothetical protein